MKKKTYCFEEDDEEDDSDNSRSAREFAERSDVMCK
jgi:hypothetical protein